MNLNDFALSPTDLALEFSDKLDAIIEARDALLAAKENYICRCSGFVLQYEGSCQCGAGGSVKEAEDAFWVVIRGL
jgi:hypothetical protein